MMHDDDSNSTPRQYLKVARERAGQLVIALDGALDAKTEPLARPNRVRDLTKQARAIAREIDDIIANITRA